MYVCMYVYVFLHIGRKNHPQLTLFKAVVSSRQLFVQAMDKN